MNDLKEPVAALIAPAAVVTAAPPIPVYRPAAAAPPKRRRWLPYLLYPLALIGLVGVGLVAYAAYQENSAAAVVVAGHTSFDEAQMVDTVMTDAFGKYSEEKRGWLYVANDNQTYVMRVIHQVHMADTPGGDNLYMLASGTPLDGATQTAVYGAFHIYPDPDKAGGLKQASVQEWVYGLPLKPEDVRFAKLSKTLWAWVVKVRSGDGETDLMRETVSILAPHDQQIVTLAQFPAAADYAPAEDCSVLKREYGVYAATSGDAEMEPDEPLRCQSRRWEYKLGNGEANLAAPITITLSGSEDGQPIAGKTWKLVFDNKVFRYLVPDDIEHYRSAAPAPVPPPAEEDVPAETPADVAEKTAAGAAERSQPAAADAPAD